MGPRIRGGTGGGWVPALVFTGGRRFVGTTEAGAWGWVPASARTREGRGPTRLCGRGTAGRFSVGTTEPGSWGWVPASARTREGWVPALVFTGGRLFAGTTEAGRDGSPHPRGHGRVHPHPPSSRGQALTFPPEEGRERGRWEGERVALRLGRLLNTMALNIPKFRSFEVIRRWLL